MLSWGRVYVTIPVSVPTRELVAAQIESLMGGQPKASDYYAAAVYYKEENMMLDQALVWMNKAMEMTENNVVCEEIQKYENNQKSLTFIADSDTACVSFP